MNSSLYYFLGTSFAAHQYLSLSFNYPLQNHPLSTLDPLPLSLFDTTPWLLHPTCMRFFGHPYQSWCIHINCITNAHSKQVFLTSCVQLVLVGSIMVLQHLQLIPRTLWKDFGGFLDGLGSADKSFHFCLALLNIYSFPTASCATLTHCKLMPSLLIMLSMSPLHSSFFSLSTLAASFLIMPDTSTPCPKTIF